jgi:hypothetical protein
MGRSEGNGMSDELISWDSLMKLRTAKPFMPFFIEFRDGATAEVLQPLWFGGAGDRFTVFHPRHRRREFRRSDILRTRPMTAEEIAERLPLLTRRGA